MGTILTGVYAKQYADFIKQLLGIDQLIYSLPWLKITAPLVLGTKSEPYFILILSEMNIVGLVPFYLERRGRGVLSFKQLIFWGKGAYYMDYPLPTVISLPEFKLAVTDRVINCLTTEYRDKFDEINLKRVDPDDPFIKRLCATFKTRWWNALTEHQHLFVDTQTIDEKLKGENLRRIRKEEKDMAESFNEVKYACQSSLDDAQIDELRQLHIKRQKDVLEAGGSRISFFDDPVENMVTVELIKYNQSVDALRVYTLRLNQKLVCFWLCFHYNKYTIAHITAFTPVPGHQYAAACLWRYMVKSETEKYGSQIVDAGYGMNILKKKFCNKFIVLSTVILSNHYSMTARMKQLFMNLLRRLKRGVSLPSLPGRLVG